MFEEPTLRSAHRDRGMTHRVFRVQRLKESAT